MPTTRDSSPMLPTEAYGVKGNLKDGVHFVDATNIVYVAGHCLILKDPSKKKHRLIPGSPNMEGISALAVSNNKRYIAVAEIAPPTKIPGTPEDEAIAKLAAQSGTAVKGPVINVYTVKTLAKKRSLSGNKAGSREFISLSFSADGKKIAALGGAPDWKLQVWNITATKVIGSMKTGTLTSSAVYQVRCCPVNDEIVTVVGDGFAKTFKTSESSVRQVSTTVTNQEGQKIFCHAWLPPVAEVLSKKENQESKDKANKDKKEKEKEKEKKEKEKEQDEDPEKEVYCGCVYARASGELLYVEDGEVVSTIPAMCGGDVCPIYVVIQYSKGFICGENGMISVYQREGMRKTYKKIRQFKVEESGAQVCALALSPTEEVLVCTVSSNHLIHLPFQQADVLSADHVSQEVSKEMYHRGLITGMDTCLLKPFVITCGMDASVRVWNYVEQSCEIVKFFPSEALSVSMHPNGLYVVIGFQESLQLFNLLIDDMRLWREFTTVKSCVDCSFSRGGQYIAAVNVNTVHIFSTYTGQNIGNLRAHINRVRSIWWAHDDYNIVTAGMDGAIYEWTLKSFKRSRENVIKGCVYTCVIGSKNSRCFLGTGSDRKLRELDELEVLKSFDSDVMLTHLALCVGGGVLFAGTESGAVRAYQYPLIGVFCEVKVCEKPIVKLCVSNDDSHLFCTSEDGLMIMFDVRAIAAPGVAARDKDVIPWCHEVLITKVDLEDYRSRVQELERKIVEAFTECEYQLRMREEKLDGRIRDLKDQYNVILDEMRAKHQELIMAKAETELVLDKKQVQTEESHAILLKEMEEAYATKMLVETARYMEIMRAKEVENARWLQRTETMSKAHEHALQELIEAYEEKIEESKDEVGHLQKDKVQLNLDFEEIRKQQEEDTDTEVEQQKAEYEKMLERANETVKHIMGENGIMKNKFLEFQRELEEAERELKEVCDQKKELYDIIRCCERDMRTLQRDLVEREETISEKDTRIYDLKKANQELEKFKYVLDFKVKDLVHEMEPSKMEAKQCKERMRKMELELLSNHDIMLHKDMTMKSLKAKLRDAGEEKKRLLHSNSNQGNLMKRFQLDFHELAHHIEDPRVLQREVKMLYEKYVANQINVADVETPLNKENFRQRDMLERKVKGLQHTLKKEKEQNQHNHLRLIHENVLLINESNELRREFRYKNISIPKKGKPSPGEMKERGSSLSRKSVGMTTTSGEINTLRTQVAELQLKLSAKGARIEFLEDLVQEQKKPLSTSVAHLPTITLGQAVGQAVGQASRS